ncbi:unnamed protein product, partial [Arctia plantaginis]
SWRVFYNEYKSKLRRVKKQKAEIQATGGGPAANITLTPLQERLYDIIGRDVGEPLEGVRHNPLFSLEDNAGVGVHEIPFSVHNTQAQAVSFEVTPSLESASSAIFASAVEPVISIVDSANSTVQASHVELIGTVEPTPRPYSGSTHRRRRGRRSLEGSQPRSAHEPTSRLEEAQRRLAEMESERTMAFTAALDRLATTIGQPLDRLATVISQLLQVYHRNSSGSPPLRKRARIIIPSESDSD